MRPLGGGGEWGREKEQGIATREKLAKLNKGEDGTQGRQGREREGKKNNHTVSLSFGTRKGGAGGQPEGEVGLGVGEKTLSTKGEYRTYKEGEKNGLKMESSSEVQPRPQAVKKRTQLGGRGRKDKDPVPPAITPRPHTIGKKKSKTAGKRS